MTIKYTLNPLPAKVRTVFYSPILLGYLMSVHERFLYLGAGGFLKPYTDRGAKEFGFLKSKNKKIICYFLGSEIRSFDLLNEYAHKNSLDVITTYQGISHIGIDSAKKEAGRKLLGEVADNYADIIFNPSVDQMAYIKRKTLPCMHCLGDEIFQGSLSKFDNLNEIIVLHGPSSPIIKGTPIVRVAIKKLQVEGYRFNYVELIDVPHEQILVALKSAHIVLNQFYGFILAVFGAEALANCCALLTSADANGAWKVTPYWQVYDNLKFFLDNPEAIKPQAIAGYNWALKNCTYAATVEKMNRIIND